MQSNSDQRIYVRKFFFGLRTNLFLILIIILEDIKIGTLIYK